jgi:PAS domain S-box-containing protein
MMKDLWKFILKNLTNITLILLGVLMLLGTAMTFYNRYLIKKNLDLLKQTDEVKRAFRYGNETTTRHVDITLRGFAVIRDEKFNYINNEQIKKGMEDSFSELEKILKIQSYQDKEGWKAIHAYQDSIRSFVAYHALMTDLLRKDSMDAFRTLFLRDKGAAIGPPYAAAEQKVDTFEDSLNRQAAEGYESAVNRNIYVQLLTLLVGLPAILLIFSNLTSQSTRRFLLLSELAENNRRYIFDSGVPVEVNAESVSRQTIANFQQASAFVKEITAGNFEAEWAGLNPENQALNTETLAGELVKMKQKMMKVKQEDDRRNWTNESLSHLNEILRRETDINLLADKILTQLIHTLNANQGALLVLNDDNPADAFLEIKAVYAYSRKKYLDKKIKRGEGLAGQTWQEAQTVYLKEIPQSYVHITSGLGQAKPNNLLLVPLKTDKGVEGVLEIASFHLFEPHQIALVEKFAENLAITLANTKITDRTQHLLEESNLMAEQLKSQEEEMRQNLEEMQATQEEVHRNSQESLRKETNLQALIDNTDSAVVAVSRDYVILAVNREMKIIYQQRGIQFGVGSHVLELMNEQEREHRKKQYDRAFAGEKFSVIEETPTAADVIAYYEISHFPLTNQEGEITGVSIFAKNITKDVLLKKELEQQQTILQGLINNTDDNIMALDGAYNVIVLNDRYKERYARMGIEYKEGMNAFNVMDEAIKEEWKGYYDRALGGEKFRITKNSTDNGKESVREYYFNPIRNQANEITGLSIFNRIVNNYQ